MSVCQVVGCARAVSKAGYAFCLDHWKADKNGTLRGCAACGRPHEGPGPQCAECEKTPAGGSARPAGDDEGNHLSSTRIGQHFGISNIKTNLILAELGWIERYVKGWVPTERGNALGANVREMRNGTPFVIWPESILSNAALRASVTEQTSQSPAPAAPAPALPGPGLKSSVPAVAPPAPDKSHADKSADFRAKFPATFRTQDGHMVRSRAEVLIDNWLYMQGIVHAYERRLPIEEECYCDFYLPKGKGVYIEFWGRESDPKYRDRMAVKQAIYAKNNMRLIELGDAEIERLDDVLPRMLLRFGVESA